VEQDKIPAHLSATTTIKKIRLKTQFQINKVSFSKTTPVTNNQPLLPNPMPNQVKHKRRRL